MHQLCGCYGVSPLSFIVVERCEMFHLYYPIGIYTPLALTVTAEKGERKYGKRGPGAVSHLAIPVSFHSGLLAQETIRLSRREEYKIRLY